MLTVFLIIVIIILMSIVTKLVYTLNSIYWDDIEVLEKIKKYTSEEK